jgi:2-keto-4-pentenoate hydratase/2-oxohepta-3-ene-1,7-dioic acid hydratase in catechol pathway
MKLVRFQDASGDRIGVLRDDGIAPITGMSSLQQLIAHSLAIQADGAGGDLDTQLLAKLHLEAVIDLEPVHLLAPIVPTRNVFCVGWNYLKHYTESIGKRDGQEQPLPDHPTLFTKPPTAVAGPGDALPLHQQYTAKLDWEVELAVIIGKEGRDIAEADALAHVFGYTIANDISARDLQRAHGGQWFKGKALDGTCPLGPMVVTAQEIGGPQNLDISCLVNGETMQSANTSRQIFSVARVIAELSAGMTLLPGDVILTGTPDGIGAARTPPRFLQDGDLIESRIEKIGSLNNRISAHVRAATCSNKDPQLTPEAQANAHMV